MSIDLIRTSTRLAVQTLCALIVLAGLLRAGIVFADPASDELTKMSLSDLAKVEVTSVSKTSEALQRAPASIYVISHDDIVRSGVTSIPQALRLAPNLLVTQTSSSAYFDRWPQRLYAVVFRDLCEHA